MKSFKYFSIIFLIFFIASCTTKNMFYGIDEEDTQGPSISVTYPSTQTISGTFTLIGTASDRGGNEILKIEILPQGSTTWTAYQLASGTTNWSITVDSLSVWGVIDADRNIQIRATDTNYKPNRSSISHTVSIDNTNPSLIGSIKDVNDDTKYDGTAAYDGYHQAVETAEIQYEWDLELEVYGFEVVLYEIDIVSQAVINDIFAQDIPADIALNRQEVDLGVGPNTGQQVYMGIEGTKIYFTINGQEGKKYYVAVKPYDINSNRGPIKLSVEETIDLQSPSAPGSGVDNFTVNTEGSSNPDIQLNTSIVSFSYTASTDPAPATGIRYYEIDVNSAAPSEYFVSGTSISHDYAVGAGVASFTARVRAVDMAGNNSAWTSLSFTIDGADPGNIAVINDTGNEIFGDDRTVTFSWAEVANADGYKIWIYETTSGASKYYEFDKGSMDVGDDAGTAIQTVNIGNDYFQFTSTNDGKKYYIQVKGYDDAGNEASAWRSSSTITVDTVNPDTVGGLEVNNASPGPVYTSNSTVNISWNTGTDGGAGIGIDFYELSTDLAMDATAEETNIFGTNTAVNLSGTRNIMVRSVDKVGNRGPWSAAINLIVDSAAPNTPSFTGWADSGVLRGLAEWNAVTDVGSAGVDYYLILVSWVAGGSDLISATIKIPLVGADLDTVVAAGRIEVNDPSTILAGALVTVPVPTSPNFDVEIYFVNAAQHVVQIKAVDKAGNETDYGSGKYIAIN